MGTPILASSVIRCSFHSFIVFLAAVLVTVALLYHTTDSRSSSTLPYQVQSTTHDQIGTVHSVNMISTVESVILERPVHDDGSLSRGDQLVDSVVERPVHDVSADGDRVDSVIIERPVHDVSADGDRVDSVVSSCDLFSGKWVYDNKSYPLYKDRECAFMFDDLACEKYGRKDLDYQYWRWQPHGCDLPRFDAKALLEKLRGKRLVFVGDSLNRNQWVSMVCLVESSIPKALKIMRLKDSLYTFKATDYNASIDFYWEPMLVESSNDNSSHHPSTNRIVKIGAIEKHARQWGDADVLVFNSYRWWIIPTLKVLKGSFEDPYPVYKEVKMLRCYKMALKTWSAWLETHVDRTKTQLFFMSNSATHSRAEEWGMPKDQNCFSETRPISKEGYWGTESDPKMMQIAEAEIRKLKSRGLKIQMLNITQLSEYRKDGHPSIYRKQWHPLSKEQLSDPGNYADCTHWCLPGVPDVWNELLSTYIIHH